MRNYIQIPATLETALRAVFREVNPFRQDPDLEDQVQVIHRATRKFRDPNLFDVIGWPDESQYDAEGNLKPERLADLLVVGAFHWKGLWIAKCPRPIPRRYGPRTMLIGGWSGMGLPDPPPFRNRPWAREDSHRGGRVVGPGGMGPSFRGPARDRGLAHLRTRPLGGTPRDRHPAL